MILYKVNKSIEYANTLIELLSNTIHYCNIPYGTLSIGNSVFSSCSYLKQVIIPDTVTSIGNESFYNCQTLSMAELPDSITSIGDRAFYGCTALSSLVVPDTVTSIGENAFYNVEHIYYNGSATDSSGNNWGAKNLN
jgi:hypothetical protein